MKNAIGFLVPFIILALLAWSSTPGDQECIDKVTTAKTGSDLAGSGQLLYQVQDHYLYKTIENRCTGRVVGYGVFTSVFLK